MASWTKEEDEILTKMVLGFLQSNKPAKQGIVAACKRLPKRTIDACVSRWNKKLKYEYESEVVQLKEKRSISWTSSEDIILTHVLEENYRNGIIGEQNFIFASDALSKKGYNRTAKACASRWSIIKYDYPHIHINIKKRSQ